MISQNEWWCLVSVKRKPSVIVAGAGIGGLTLALELHAAGIDCVLLEAAPELTELGVGINLLPHATRSLSRLGLLDALSRVAVATKESIFFTRHGQFIYRAPAGLAAGYAWPQLSIHRGDLQRVLSAAVRGRLGADAVRLGHRVTGFTQGDDAATVTVEHADGTRSALSGDVLVGADGVHSAVRGQLHPEAGRPHYTGYMMWRGTTVHPPFLSGASMVRAGWLATGKLVAYPIRENADGNGSQLVNWLAEVEGPERAQRDWTRRGELDDFIGHLKAGTSTGSTCPRCSAAPRRYSNTRWSTRTRCPGGPAAGSPSSVTPPTRWCRAGPTGRPRRSSTRRRWQRCSPAPGERQGRHCAPMTTNGARRPLRWSSPTAATRRTPSCARCTSAPPTGLFVRLSDVISDAEIAALMSAYRNVAGSSAEQLGGGA